MHTDQEGLLPERGSKLAGLNWGPYSNQGSPVSRLRRNIILLLIAIAFFSCLAIHFYLNMKAIQGPLVPDDSVAHSSRSSKPLSRRKPILDNESIFSDSGPSMIRLSDLFAHCIVALQVAGRDVVGSSLKNQDHLDKVASKGLTKEGINDPVTGADIRSHKTIVRTISDSYPRLTLVSEEDQTTGFETHSLKNNLLPLDRADFAMMLREQLSQIEARHVDWNSLIAQDDTLVWIDPLDATKEYSENLTQYVTLMACIVHKSQPIAGVIYKPFEKETYWSIRDNTPSAQWHHSPELSSLLEKNQSPQDGLKKSIQVIISRSHAGNVDQFVHDAFKTKINTVPAGGSGYKTIELVAGRVDAYLHLTNIKKWDICAPNAIINSISGAIFTDRNGNPISYGDRRDQLVETGIIATLRSDLHQTLKEKLSLYEIKSGKDLINSQ